MFPSTVSVGCDSGFGNATAKRLDAMGFEVFATVLNMDGEGAKHLRRVCSSCLTLLQVDITQPQQVQQALLDTKAKLGMRGEDLLLSYKIRRKYAVPEIRTHNHIPTCLNTMNLKYPCMNVCIF